MTTRDACQRFVFEDTDIRGELVQLESAYQQCVEGHDYPPPVRRLLGEFLAAAVVLGSTIKFDGRLVLQAHPKGQISLAMAECTDQGTVRGIVRSREEPTAEDFATLMGGGTLAITIEPRDGEPYQGIVPLEGRSLADCLQTYFAQSEQLSTYFQFAVDEKQVLAMMLQQLPAYRTDSVEERENQWQHVRLLAQTLEAQELLSEDNETVLHRLYHQDPVRLFDPEPVAYRCTCSRERTAGALLSIGKEEVDSIVEEQGGVSISCEFCGTEYNYGPEEIRLLMQERGETTH